MTTRTIPELIAEIKRREQELDELENQLEKAKSEPYEVQLARELHGSFCKWNHTDGCSWFYEFDYIKKQENWDGSAHSEYLGRARKLILKCSEKSISPEVAIELAKMIGK